MSTPERPKQLLPLVNERPLLANTLLFSSVIAVINESPESLSISPQASLISPR